MARWAETWVVVVAAGTGSRFGRAKQFVSLAGRPLLVHSVAVACAGAAGVVVVVPAEAVIRVRGLLDESRGADWSPVAVVAGGETRSGSVANGLAEVPASAVKVLVHDGARPLVDAALFDRVVAALANGAAAVVPATAVVDSLRWRDGGVVDRSKVVAVQTPQGFRAEVLRKVHENGGEGTDDASLVEAAGFAVVLVDGDAANFKVTVPSDLAMAEALIAERNRHEALPDV